SLLIERANVVVVFRRAVLSKPPRAARLRVHASELRVPERGQLHKQLLAVAQRRAETERAVAHHLRHWLRLARRVLPDFLVEAKLGVIAEVGISPKPVL